MSPSKSKALTFTKRDVTNRVAEKIGSTYSSTKGTVDAVFESLREIMSQDHRSMRIEIRGFGVFEVKPTKAKPKARNPRTNEVIYVPARRKSHFRPGKELKGVLKQPLKT